MARDLDLNVGTPGEVPVILRRTAEAYRETTGELQSAWGDPNAAQVWTDFATILERAADSCDRAISRRKS